MPVESFAVLEYDIELYVLLARKQVEQEEVRDPGLNGMIT